VAASLSVSVGAVSAAEQRARRADLDWATVESLSDAALEIRLYGAAASDRHRSLPDPATLHTELKRQGVTLQLLHHEYREQHPGGYGYTQFCDHYRLISDNYFSRAATTISPGL
jgi:transposase